MAQLAGRRGSSLRTFMAALALLACGRGSANPLPCNATVRAGWSVGMKILQTTSDPPAACCAACVALPTCMAFVTDGGKCYLKADLGLPHPKAGNTAGIVRGTLPPPPPPPPTPPAPAPGAPQWELFEATATPIIGQAQARQHGILAGFETGQFQRLGETFYYTANELGLCEGVVWDKVTRAGLWSAPNSTGPWTRLTTLRNGSHMWSLCNRTGTPYPGAKDNLNYVTWTPALLHAPSSANGSAAVWNLFYSSKQDRAGDKDVPWGLKYNGISWAVSTTGSIEGPYVDVVGAGADGVVVNDSHSFSAWRLRNGSYAGFRNNVRGAPSFSNGLIVPVDPATPGGEWRDAGPNIGVQDGSYVPGKAFRWGPENAYVLPSADGRWYFSVYDALRQPPAVAVGGKPAAPRAGSGGSSGGDPPICSSKTGCDSIGIAWSSDGLYWDDSTLLAVQTDGNHPCGQIRTPLGIAAEPERCRGCYSVLWNGISDNGFRPVCHAIIRNVNECAPSPAPAPPTAAPTPSALPPPAFELVQALSHPVISLPQTAAQQPTNHGGFEGGLYTKTVEDGLYMYHLFPTECMSDMVGVAWDIHTESHHWVSPDGVHNWTMAGLAFNSSAKRDGSDRRAAIFAPMNLWDADAGRWTIFYIGYTVGGPLNPHGQSDGAVYRVESATPGRGGIDGPYPPESATIVLDEQVGHKEAWEGYQGDDSFHAWQLDNGTWAGFYGSHGAQPLGVQEWQVGLATAPKLAGPWTRVPWLNPASYIESPEGIENPIVTRTTDRTAAFSFVAVFDALVPDQINATGTKDYVGITQSADGIHWSPAQYVSLNASASGCGSPTRTPQGLVAEPGRCQGCYSMLYTGYSSSDGGYRNECWVLLRNKAELMLG